MSTTGGRDKLRVGVAMSWLVLMSCEASQPAPPGGADEPVRQGSVVKHVSEPVLVRHLDAYIYGDLAGALETHIASTSRSTWCTSRSFSNLLEQVRRGKDEAACAQAVAVTSNEAVRDALLDEEQLMMQTMRFVCEQPDATCQDYAKSVYRSSITQTPSWSARLSRYEIRSMSEDRAGEVKAYVDLEFAPPVGLRRELLVMERVDGDWVVSQGPESLSREIERE